MFTIRPYTQTDLERVVDLWELCGLTRPWNHPEIDIFRKISRSDELFLVAIKDEKLVGTLMGGYDGHRGWVSYLAVHPHHQRVGIATALMQQIEKRLIALGCPKLQLLVRKDNLGVVNFYEQLGYDELEVFCFGKRLIHDD